MNVYDFDRTIYRGDSSIDFYLFCTKIHPFIIVKHIPSFLNAARWYYLKKITKEQLKESFFSFLSDITDLNELIEHFWEERQNKIFRWYFINQLPDDVIISASPEFLLMPICSKLGVRHLIASQVDPHTGRFSSLNCYGEEKVRRFRSAFGDVGIDNFYSDSKSDLPLKIIAKNGWLVRNGKPQYWESKL